MFESSLEDHAEAKAMVPEYEPADFFKQDLFTELVSKQLVSNHKLTFP
jgi:hypothetical protein